MSTQTNKLGLFKYDPIIDQEELFDIQTSLNDNWDKIDAAIVQSDWNQNNDSAIDYIKNRPFYETRQSTEIWDGNLDTALDSIIVEFPDYGMKAGWVKISNEPISFTSENYKFLVRGNFDGEDQESENYAYVQRVTDDYISYHDGHGSAQMYNIIADSYQLGEEGVLTRGVWGQYLKEINTNNGMYYAGLLGDSEIKKIDQKYLPDTLSTKEYVDEAIAAIPAPDMNQYYTKTEVDAAIAAAIEAAFANITKAEEVEF